MIKMQIYYKYNKLINENIFNAIVKYKRGTNINYYSYKYIIK